MGILDKVMFWKKNDDLGDMDLGGKDNLAFGDNFGGQPGATPGMPDAGMNPGMDQGMGQQPPGMAPQQQPPPPSFSQYPQQFSQPSYAPQPDIESKNLEIISSKLDAIRASIDSLNQRLANLEAIARGEEEDSRKRRYY
jgi:hypothetical protein